MSDTRAIAKTILDQISLSTKMACGFRNLSCGMTAEHIPYLSVRVGETKRYLYVRIYYIRGTDSYTVEVYDSKKGYEVTIQEFEDVYCEQLSSIIYHAVNK